MKTDTRSPAEVLTTWVHAYGDALFAWAKYKTASQEVAEDLVQETYLSALRNFDSFRGDSQPKTWLMRILNNKIADHYRKLAHAPDSLESRATTAADALFDTYGVWEANGHEAAWENDEHLLDNSAFQQMLAFCLDRLPPKWATAIRAKYLLEKNTSETCQVLGITPSNYWQILHRAKLSLKTCLESAWAQ